MKIHAKPGERKIKLPLFRFPFIHTLPRFFPLSNYATSFVNEENQNFGEEGGEGGRNRPSWNSFSPFNPAPRNDTREEKKMASSIRATWPRTDRPFNIAVKLGRNWFPLESLGLHLTNERIRGGEENKRRKINDYYVTFANQLEERIYPTILINWQELEDRWSPTGIYFRPWDEDITGFTGSPHPSFDDFVAHEYIRTHDELLNRVTRVETNTCVRWLKGGGKVTDGPRKEGREGEAQAELKK